MDKVCSFYISSEVRKLIPVVRPSAVIEKVVQCHWCFNDFDKYDCRYVRYGDTRKSIVYICNKCAKKYKGKRILKPVMYDYIAGE